MVRVPSVINDIPFVSISKHSQLKLEILKLSSVDDQCH